jgi:WD40-like Beta Propeller Repeat
MTRFRDALDEYADQAPPLGTIADRVLARSRRSRHRRRLGLAAPLGAVGLVAASVFGLAAAGMLPWQQPGREVEPATPRLRLPMTVAFPKTAQPLPDKGVGRALLAYNPNCKSNERRVVVSCEPWRVMTADRKHWTVPDAAWPDDEESRRQYDRGSLTVSPDGTRIAYFRDNGAFVVRNLASGSVRQAFSWAETPWKFDDGTPEVTWSPDSRWIGVAMPDVDVIDGRSTAVNPQKAELVDTETMRTHQMPGSCCFYGLPDTGALIAFSDGLRDHPIKLVDNEGKVHGELPSKLPNGKSWDGFQGTISPDGKTFAAIGFPKDLTAEVSVVRIEDKRVLARYPIRDNWETWESPVFAGWAAPGVPLIESGDIKGMDLPMTLENRGKANVERFDVESGTREVVFQFPVRARSLTIAYKTLG